MVFIYPLLHRDVVKLRKMLGYEKDKRKNLLKFSNICDHVMKSIKKCKFCAMFWKDFIFFFRNYYYNIVFFSSTWFSIPLNTMDDVNIAENADTVCFVDPDPPIFPSTSRSVTESIVLKMTKKTVTFSDGIAENVRETKISKSKTYCKRP